MTRDKKMFVCGFIVVITILSNAITKEATQLGLELKFGMFMKSSNRDLL